LAGRDADYKHCRFFTSRAAWFKIEVDLLGSAVLGLKMLGLHEYFGDPSDTNPQIDIVWPPNNNVYLPSQTVYMTAKVDETDGDNCHFRFDLFKESNPNPTSADTLNENTDLYVATIDSNALNLDGSDNVNYKREYFSLLNQGGGSTNVVHLKELRNAQHIMIKPLQGSGGETVFDIKDFKVYRVGSNTPVYVDSAGGSGAVSAKQVDIASITGTAKAWLIDLGSIEDIIKFEFTHHDSSGNNIQNFELRFVTSAGATSDPADAEWIPSTFETAWIADIQYCWPYEVTDNPDGYNYNGGTPADTSNNPENNGKEGYATRVGRWRTVPAFSGVIASSSNQGAAVTYDLADASQGGDSPLAVAGDDTVVYVRISLPDPYRNQERYYFKPGVWDGQVQNI